MRGIPINHRSFKSVGVLVILSITTSATWSDTLVCTDSPCRKEKCIEADSGYALTPDRLSDLTFEVTGAADKEVDASCRILWKKSQIARFEKSPLFYITKLCVAMRVKTHSGGRKSGLNIACTIETPQLSIGQPTGQN